MKGFVDDIEELVEGKGEVVIDGERSKIKGDDAIIVPAGARHNVVNTGDDSARFLAFRRLLRRR